MISAKAKALTTAATQASVPPNQNQGASMSTLTAAQKAVSNSAEFRRAFGVLHRAAIGVVLCRTHEPYRLVETLRAFAWAEREMEFRSWAVTSGWVNVNKNRPTEAEQDNVLDPIAALRKVLDTSSPQGFAPGVYSMLYPNVTLDRNPVFVQWVKEASRTLPEMRKRLILITPPGYVLPQELQTDVVVLDFDLPSYRELREGYDEVIGSIREAARRPRFTEDELDTLLANGAGMTRHEFVSTLSRAIMAHSTKLPDVPAETIAQEILTVKTEAVKRSEVLEVMPVEDMANVGGLAALKDWVSKRRVCFSQEAREFGIDPLKGILLAGPPGTGKSLMAKAIAHELGLPLVKFDVSRVFASLVGQSEQRVEEALKMLEAMSPCVAFLDEIDKALGGTQSGGGDSGVGKRVLGKVLTWLQENQSSVFCVFSANRVQDLPSELLRRGRLDEIFSVSVPSKAERLEVVRIHLRKRGKNPDDIPNLELAVEKEGYVPAELEAAVKDALIEAFTTKTPITGASIAQQIDFMVPLSVAFAADFSAMQTWAEQNARPANGPVGSRPVKVRTRSTVAQAPGASVRTLEIAEPTATGGHLDG